MISNPFLLLAILIGMVWAVTRLSSNVKFQNFFKYLPAPLWCYFVPTVLSTMDMIPSSSPLYTWMSRLVLPACLILLLIGTDLPSIARLSPRSIFAMVAGSVGIFLGGTITFLLAPTSREIPELWKGWACLSASWTGGSANMVSVKELLNAPETLFSNLILVDTVIAYSWMAFLIYVSRFRNRLDTWLGARDLLSAPSGQENKNEPGSFSYLKTAGLLVFGFALAGFFWKVSGEMPEKGAVLNRFTWLILFSTILPLAFSLTPASKIDSWGASRTGNFLLYLLLTSIGAKADLRALAQAPSLILLGLIWAAVAGTFLLLYGKLTRTSISILATASQANIGGTVSAPLVASVYDRRLAPVGLILAVLGNIYGTYAALAFSEICRRL
jgi:uncharacterized membrane protein